MVPTGRSWFRDCCRDLTGSSAELAGFSRLIQEDLVLRIGTTLQVDLTMRVGAVQESLTVTAEAPQVDLTTAQVGGNVSAGEIRNLPSANGNFTSLIAILPGVVYNRASDGQSDNVTINGQPGTGVVFMLDGGSNNDDLRGGSAGAQTRPALETIQEFQVVTNQFDAEYGAALSGVVNAITKQGTNAYHGSAVGLFTNAAMTSKDFFVEQQGLDEAGHAQHPLRRHDRRADHPRQDALLRQLRRRRTATKGGATTIRRGPT